MPQLRGLPMEKLTFLSCFNIFTDFTGTIVSQLVFFTLRWWQVFCLLWIQIHAFLGKKECDCLSTAVQKKESKLFFMLGITFETAYYLKIFWGQKLHHSGKIEILTFISIKIPFAVLAKSTATRLKTYSRYRSKCCHV